MTNKEKEDLEEGEENSDEKNHPLSREGWIMLLSGEINKEEMKLTSYWNVCIVILIAFLGIEVAFLVVGFQSGVVYDGNVHMNGAIFRAILILIILVLAMFIVLALIMEIYEKRLQKRLKPLIKAREATIFSKSTDFSEIGRIWKEYVEKWLLEKSEMDEEEKESEGEKDDSKEKDSEKKNVKDQKHVLQVLQSDIRDIKESLQEIKSSLGKLTREMEGTKFFSGRITIGSIFIAIGFAAIFAAIGMSVFSISLFSFLILFGLIMICFGISVIYCKNIFSKYLHFIFCLKVLLLPFIYFLPSQMYSTLINYIV